MNLEKVVRSKSLKQLKKRLNKMIQENEETLTQRLEREKPLSNLKGELLHLILSDISPMELKWIEENKNRLPNSKQEHLYILIGKIIDKIKR